MFLHLDFQRKILRQANLPYLNPWQKVGGFLWPEPNGSLHRKPWWLVEKKLAFRAAKTWCRCLCRRVQVDHECSSPTRKVCLNRFWHFDAQSKFFPNLSLRLFIVHFLSLGAFLHFLYVKGHCYLKLCHLCLLGLLQLTKDFNPSWDTFKRGFGGKIITFY